MMNVIATIILNHAILMSYSYQTLESWIHWMEARKLL